MRVAKKYLEIALKKILEYRVETLYLSFFVLLPLFVYPTLWLGLSERFGNLNGWTFPTLVLLGILSNTIFSFSDVLGMFNAYKMFKGKERAIITVFMTKPYGLIKQIFFNNINGTALGRFIPNVLILIGTIVYFKINITLSFVVALIMGTLLFELFMVMLLTGLLAMDRSGLGLIQTMWVGVKYSSMPLNQLSGVAMVLLYIIMPIAFIGSVPASAIFEGLSMKVIGMWAISAALMIVISLFFLRQFKKNFEAIGG